MFDDRPGQEAATGQQGGSEQSADIDSPPPPPGIPVCVPDHAYEDLQKRADAFQRDLTLARRVQATFVPRGRDFPLRDELVFAGHYEAMADVGGDLYDIARVGKNAYGMIMADASGHGMATALITALVKLAFRDALHWGARTDEICSSVNATLFELLGDGERYVTAFVAIVNLETGTLEYTNAGHHPALLVRGGRAKRLTGDGGFFGIFRDPSFGRGTVALEPGDLVVLFTDGIIESRGFDGEEFGLDRFLSAVLEHAVLPPAELVRAVVERMGAFTMGAPPHDDRSLLCAAFRGRAEPLRRDGLDTGERAACPPCPETEPRSRDEDPERTLLFMQAVGLTAKGDRKAALRAWEEYLDLYPEDSRALNNAGVLLYRMGRIVDASSRLRRALIASPGDRRILRNLALVSSGEGGI